MKRAERNTPSEHPQATSRPWGRLRLWCGLAVAGLLLCAAAAEAGPATGKPVISGPPQVDETLTVDTSAISDTDGLGTFNYQWVRGRKDISGATGSAYTPVEADLGKKLKVKVSFTDGGGNQESVTSDAYPRYGYPWDDIGIVAAKAACPADADWCAEMTVGFLTQPGQVLINYYFGYEIGWHLSQPMGSISSKTISHTNETYKLTQVELTVYTHGTRVFRLGFRSKEVPDGTILRVGGSTSTLRNNDWTVTREGYGYYRKAFPAGLVFVKDAKMTVSVTFPEHATGRPTISGTANVGETLSVSTEDIADPDGNTKAEDGETGYAYTYQWIRVATDSQRRRTSPGATGEHLHAGGGGCGG